MIASRIHKHVWYFLLFALIAIGVLFFVFPDIAHATSDEFTIERSQQIFEENTRLGGDDIRIIIARVIQVFLGLLGIIAVSIFVYAGYLWMTSAGQEDKITQAKKMMVNAVIGIAIIFSAFAIVSFIINALANATGFGGRDQGDAIIPFDSFDGTGALGHIIVDHYPEAGQQGVARNTKIVVTFREPINPASIIANETPVGDKFGVCADPGAEEFSWEVHCDQLATSSIYIFEDTEESYISGSDDITDAARHGAAVTIAYEPDDPSTGFDEGTLAKTFVFRPYEYLGYDSRDSVYAVRITNLVTKTFGGDGIFVNERDRMYQWDFGVSTELDTTPPHVTYSFPADEGQIFRNNIIQVTFSEPVDPTTVQGQAGSANMINILLGADNDVDVTGFWRSSNGYRSTEFLSDLECGNNSCGDVMYCLPVDSSSCSGPSCTTGYEILIRTAATVSAESWEARPGVGVTDMAGNALDSEPLGVRDDAPLGGDPAVIDDNERAPDNYFWDFAVKHQIDFSIPHVRSIIPSVDAQGIRGSAPIVMSFSHIMWLSTLEEIALLEEGDGVDQLASIWYLKRSSVTRDGGSGDRTLLTIPHREFGPNNLDLFYFVSTDSEVKANNQNCLYPGRGPGNQPGAEGDYCEYVTEDDGTIITDIGCVPVTFTSSTDTGCAHSGPNVAQRDVAACLRELRIQSGLTP